MAKKSKKSHAEPEVERLSTLDNTDLDSRPTSSPYASPHVNVLFGATGKALKVPKCILKKCSNLPPYDSSWDNSNLRLPHVLEEVGHIFVHHLFTGTFQCLAPQGSNILERRTAEFTTCIRAYTVAQKYKVSLLAEQARAEIERLGQTIPFPVILSALVDAGHVPCTDNIWLSDYLKAQMKLIFNDRKLMKAIMATEVAATSSVAEVLFHGVLCLRIEESVSDCNSDSSGFDETPQHLNSQKISDSHPDESFIPIHSTVNGRPVDEVPVDTANLMPVSDIESPVIITPTSSTEFDFGTVTGTPLDAGPSVLSNELSKQAKNSMTKEKRGYRVGKGLKQLNTGCELMEEHMRPGAWMSCYVCRSLVQNLAAEVLPADKEAPLC